QKEKNVMSYFVMGALTALTLAIITGFILAWNLSFSSIVPQENMLFTHITLGVAGWFTLLIFGFSYYLIPMFSLSHVFSMKWAKPAFFTFLIGLLMLIISFWLHHSGLQMISWFILFAGFGFFVLVVREILAKRLRKKLDKPFS